jgi:hypothetical protein
MKDAIDILDDAYAWESDPERLKKADDAYAWNEDSFNRAMQRSKELIKELEAMTENMAEANTRMISINKARVALRKIQDKKGK